MLQRLKSENFKAFKEVEIRPALITVLIGENGTGKSSLGQALTLLKQSVGQGRLVTDGPQLRLGQFQDLIFAGDLAFPMVFDLTLANLAPAPPLIDRQWSYDYQLVFRHGMLTRHQAILATNGDRLLTVRYDVQTGQGSVDGTFSFEDAAVPEGERRTLKGSVAVNPQSTIGTPFQIDVSLGGMKKKFGEEAAETISLNAQRAYAAMTAFLQKVFLVSAIRGFERPDYQHTNAALDLTSAESAPIQSGVVISTLVQYRQYEDSLNELLEAVTGRSVKFRVIEPQKVTLEVPLSHGMINVVNEGFGTNQLVRTLLQILMAPSESLIVIEEPEIHLHPRAQINLTKVLLEHAQEDRKQLILVTHSEHILVGLLNAVAEGKLKRQDLAVYYFAFGEPDATNPSVSQLEVKKDGSIVGGLRGFFEVELEEMDRYIKALGSKA